MYMIGTFILRHTSEKRMLCVIDLAHLLACYACKSSHDGQKKTLWIMNITDLPHKKHDACSKCKSSDVQILCILSIYHFPHSEKRFILCNGCNRLAAQKTWPCVTDVTVLAQRKTHHVLSIELFCQIKRVLHNDIFMFVACKSFNGDVSNSDYISSND